MYVYIYILYMYVYIWVFEVKTAGKPRAMLWSFHLGSHNHDDMLPTMQSLLKNQMVVFGSRKKVVGGIQSPNWQYIPLICHL